MNRRLVPMLGVLVAGSLLGACAQGTSDDTSEKSSYDPDAKLSGDLTVLGFGGEDEIGQTRLDAAESALGSGVKVKLVKGDLDIQQFLSSVASGEPPEIIYANRNQVGTFAARGAIMPLTDCIDGEGIDTSVYRETALNEVTFNDQVYGIPEFNVVQIIQANQKLLDKAGVSVQDVNGSDWEA